MGGEKKKDRTDEKGKVMTLRGLREVFVASCVWGLPEHKEKGPVQELERFIWRSTNPGQSPSKGFGFPLRP